MQITFTLHCSAYVQCNVKDIITQRPKSINSNSKKEFWHQLRNYSVGTHSKVWVNFKNMN